MAEPQAAQAGGAQMPKIDFAKLDEYMKGRGRGLGQVEGEGEVEAEPDVVALQEEFQGVKDGDTYTDANGQQWEYRVVEYQVVPEEVKDEEVDALSGEPGEAEHAEEEAEEGDSRLEDALDVALSVLAEEEEGAKGSARVETGDEAIDIVMDAVAEVLDDAGGEKKEKEGKPAIVGGSNHPELNGRRELDERRTREGYSEPKGLTWKQGGGWEVDDPSELSATKQKRKEFEKTGDGRYRVKADKSKYAKSAQTKAGLSNRRPVAATWEDCRAKDKSRCRWHGAAYMSHLLGEVLKANGVKSDKFGIQVDYDKAYSDIGPKAPLGYRLIFSTPVGTPMDVKNKIAKEFFARNPAITFREGGKHTPPPNANDDTVFEIGDTYDDDMPIDAPTLEDLAARHYTPEEAAYQASGARRSGMQWWRGDESKPSEFFAMLSEKPTNIVELNEDIIRYAKDCPEYLPEGVKMESLMEDYNEFKKANAEKNGAEAFLIHGVMKEGAEELVKDATGLVDEAAKRYYAISQKIYDRGAVVFRAIEDGLWDKYMSVKAKGANLPSYNKLVAERGQAVAVMYAGSKFQGKKPFPMEGWSKATDKILQDSMKDIRAGWDAVTSVNGMCFSGCEVRNPLEVYHALSMMEDSMARAQAAISALGRTQDQLLAKASPELKKALGFREIDAGAGVGEKAPKAGNGEKPEAEEEPKDKKGESAVKREEKPEEKKQTGTGTGEAVETAVAEVEEKVETGADPYKGKTGDAIITGLKVSDSPTLEEAKELNKGMAALERRLRGLVEVLGSGADDGEVEEEVQATKDALARFQKDAAKKGLYFTKDATKFDKDGMPDSRPMDLPKNFRVQSLKGADGKMVRVPYTVPAAGEMDKPEAKSGEGDAAKGAGGARTSTGKANTGKKTSRKSLRQLDADFDDYSEKIGRMKNGKTLGELVDKEGYDFHVVQDPETGAQRAFLVVKDKETGAIDKSKGAVDLAAKFNSLAGNEGKGPDAYHQFLRSVERRVEKAKKAREDEDFLSGLGGGF